MKIINQSVEILDPLNSNKILKKLELIGRVCYKSEDKITGNSAEEFIKKIIDLGHESILEHFSFSVRFITDRGVTHEIVRHRLASYAQESTRYCNYSDDKFGNELTFVQPVYIYNYTSRNAWIGSMESAEVAYMSQIKDEKMKPEEARMVLPISLKSELIMTANLREWRHFLKLRTSKKAHPQMRALAVDLLKKLQKKVGVIFDDIEIPVG